MFSLKRKLSDFSISLEINSKLFYFLIRPIITYGSEVWPADYSINLINIDPLLTEKLHHKFSKKGKRKVQGVPQSQTAALPRHQEEEETDKSKQAQIKQTYEKHYD